MVKAIITNSRDNFLLALTNAIGHERIMPNLTYLPPDGGDSQRELLVWQKASETGILLICAQK
jgi:hypothetical protein